MGASGFLQRVRRPRSGSKPEGGFTLIELLIVTAIMPMIIGALSAGLLAVFSLQNSVSNRLANSSDSEIVSASYVQDVQAADYITTATMTAVPACGTSSQTEILGLKWTTQVGTTTVVSYVETQAGTKYELVRQFCANGVSSTPTSTSIISYNMPFWAPPTASLVSILPAASSTAAQTTWANAQPVTDVTLSITEPGGGSTGSAPFTYTLVAVPAAGRPLGQQGSPVATTTGCSFALPGTGTYAPSLCFIDFSPLNIAANQTSATSPGSMAMTAAVPGGYTLSFTISITNEATAPVVGDPFPTWGGSFMGNASNGIPFYSGVGCPSSDATTYVSGGTTYGTKSCTNPALYQTANETTNIVTLGSISLIDPEGVAATGWQLVSGDGESTDPNEHLIWTSNNDWSQIPNDQVSGELEEGDACNASVNGNPGSGGTYVLSGIGTPTVECESGWQDSSTTPRTGAVMLETPTPTTVSVNMLGAGYQGIFFGLMLPS